MSSMVLTRTLLVSTGPTHRPTKELSISRADVAFTFEPALLDFPHYGLTTAFPC